MLLQIDQRGAVTLPEELRQGLDDDVLFEAVRRDDGVIELRPRVPIDLSQRWFWTERWQRMEREADADIAAGRVRVFDDVERFLDALDE